MSEIREILGVVPGLELLDLDDAGIGPSPAEDDLEPYDTFEENARSKAEYFHRLSGLPTVADDSGLEVDALGGAPGVRSKRFAPGDDLDGLERDLANNRHLVERLADTAEEERTARYVCVAAFVEGASIGDRHALLEPGADTTIFFRGEAAALVIEVPRGNGGFGYDPHMLDPDRGRTFAEMSPEEKNAKSHRGKAFRALATVLADGMEARA